MNDINLDELTTKYFNFLVEDFDFAKAKNKYVSDDIVIEIKYGRHQPDVLIRPRSEPDFTSLGLNWFFYYYIKDFDTSSIRKIDLEKSTFEYSSLFQEFAETIINKIQSWWLPVQIYRLETLEKDFGEKLEMFKEVYDYVDEKTKKNQ